MQQRKPGDELLATPKGVSKVLYLFKGCEKCSGDLVQEASKCRCFQCGSVYYPKRSEVQLQLDGVLMDRSLPVDDGESSRKPPIVGQSARHLNPLVTASRFNEELWSTKTQLVIFHRDQGKKVWEIAEIVEKGPR